MRRIRLATAFLASIALAITLGSMSASAQSGPQDKVAPAQSIVSSAPSAKVEGATPATVRFGTLAGVTAIPMKSNELDAVKGLHVHFLDAGNGALHLAGDIKTENNWKNLGGSDGLPVAPSYHGLCVAIGVGGPAGITIPGSIVEC
jgi:hypothetical protein